MRDATRFLQANIGFIVFSIGLIFWLSAQTFAFSWAKIEVDQILAALGSAIVFSGALQWLFDTFSKPQLFREVSERALGNQRLVFSGLQDFFCDSKKVDYAEAIENDDDLIIAVNYAPRLLEDCFQLLRERVAKGKNLTVFALDPGSVGYNYVTARDTTATHIPTDLEKVERKIKEISKGAEGKVVLLRHPNALSYSFVATKRVAWLKLYRNSAGTATVPAFCVGKNSELFKFVWADIEDLKRQSRE
jgi:hypothetical protein